MAIPVICTVCRTSMKVSEGFTEPKKIRCSGCGTLILLTPDPTNPSNVAVSFPRKKDKKRGLTENQKRIAIYAIFGGFCLFFLYVLYWANKAPEDRAAVEGKVTLDGTEMLKGKIRFDSLDGKFTATGDIERGRYAISVRSGPGIGPNKVKITCFEKTGNKVPNPSNPLEEIDEVKDLVSPSYHTPDNQQIQVLIKAGSNTFDFEPFSK
jgi:hypothetical protein